MNDKRKGKKMQVPEKVSLPTGNPMPPPKTYEDGVKAGYEAATLDLFLSAAKMVKEGFDRVLIPKRVYDYITPMVKERRQRLPNPPDAETGWEMMFRYIKDGNEVAQWNTTAPTPRA